MTIPEIMISFTSIGGYTATITGEEPALRAIEEAFERAGIKFNEEVGAWDEGYYSQPRDD
jgi:hypothetical protein